MDLFLFLVIAILCSVFLFSFLYPSLTEQEEEEEDFLDSTETRLEVLLQGVLDPRPEIRERYRNRILSMGPAVIPRLTGHLSQELFLDHNQIKILRLEELIQDFGQRAVPALLQLLQEEGNDPAISFTVGELLRKLGSAAGPFLIERYRKPVNKHLRPILLGWGKRAFRDSMDILRLEPQRREWNDLFQGWLEELPEEATQSLIQAYQQWSNPAKSRALEILVHSPTTFAASFLRELASSQEINLRKQALQGLAQLADPTVFDFCQDTETTLRHQAFQALADKRFSEQSQRIIETLRACQEDALQESDLKGVAFCETTLCHWSQAANPEILEKLFATSEIGLRRQALELSKHLPQDAHEHYLEVALKENSKALYNEAFRQLSVFQGSRRTDLIIESMEKRSDDHDFLESAQSTLISIGKGALRPLRRLLGMPHSPLFTVALQTLLRMEDKETLYEILEILQEPTIYALMDESALRDLRRFLRKQFKQPTVDYTVSTFLQRFPDTPLRPLLEESLERFQRNAANAERLSLSPKSES
ncbi:MAG: hypothetical protein H6727_01595 [Myxococcales bacterium]|nr:hypothetical protein [Myxococcales bacterium]